MFKKIEHITQLLVFGLFSVIMLSCSDGGDDSPDIPPGPQEIIPSNLILNVEIIGADANNPNGNGSGQVRCTATATNAVKFGFKFDNSVEIQSQSGDIEYTFSNVGLNSYVISVFAYSSSNNVISSSKIVAVLVNNQSGATWSDEFNYSGAPKPSNWTYDLGDGGWGNNEVQTYTSTNKNVIVEDGVLKIIARAEDGEYTSARIKSENLYEFKYGRVEVRAKLPSSLGTWPAIWMLGANFDTVGWSTCGEIDIMEQTGWDKNTILGTCHWLDSASSSNASYGLNTVINTATTEFHIYSMEWDASTIKIFVDDTQYYAINIANSEIQNSPFHDKFFIILNVAMGGTLGGDIDPEFTEDTMEIDYVRVYQ
ncbi:glycoside hydrolase family 16 protein [Yeosuana sp. MJ-SS3]|uniref:Glycoside hydrolase family 16 protein n=1 Tax=Gilvirhabdus luticola TaxID=3079858 RepID=A0ABU3U5H6_9FLAO|nr:glycoside hydrolase family 16 protein [Yeosuana sp. MJ-SS3]MDU8885661.1 glycoside hydrolase family 16 protein [Yeosuana sp. MJ-SS3]